MIKLPRTLHLEGSRLAAGQVDPDAVQFNKLKGQFLHVEEKVDGTGVSLFFDHNLDMQIWHRGHPAVGAEFKPLWKWFQQHDIELFDVLSNRYVMFGEWMWYKHSIFYDRLPDFFLESDVYDSEQKIWLSTLARSKLFLKLSFLKSVQVMCFGGFENLKSLTSMASCLSYYQSEVWKYNLETQCQQSKLDLQQVLSETDMAGLMEGIYIKHETDDQVLGRYKYVRHDFVQKIITSGSHYMDRTPIYNVVQ